MARNAEVERRLENWARWKVSEGSGGLGYSSATLFNTVSQRAMYRQAIIPTIDCEAEETNRAVNTLDSDLRRTLEVFYLEPEGYAIKAARLCVSVAGMYRRIERAHGLLHAWFTDMDARRRDERRRVEVLQKGFRRI